MPHLTSCACRINANTGKFVTECALHSAIHAERDAAYAEIGRFEVELADAIKERDRLQLILDSRPAINTGLLEAYIEWTQGVYLADIGKAVGHN